MISKKNCPKIVSMGYTAKLQKKLGKKIPKKSFPQKFIPKIVLRIIQRKCIEKRNLKLKNLISIEYRFHKN